MLADAAPDADLSEDEREAWTWHYQEAERLGLSRTQARLLANRGVTAYDMRHLAELGYTPDQIVTLLR